MGPVLPTEVCLCLDACDLVYDPLPLPGEGTRPQLPWETVHVCSMCRPSWTELAEVMGLVLSPLPWGPLTPREKE